MHDLINKIKEDAQQLVLDIGQAKQHTELHERAFRILMNSIELESSQNDAFEIDSSIQRHQKSFEEQHKDGMTIAFEKLRVEKLRVKKKLILWAKRPNQLNHKILRKYLELRNNGNTQITDDLLCDALIKDESITSKNTFYSNFAQMKTDSPKSHGKIFEIIDGVVKIWEPVVEYVESFNEKVFN